MIQRPKQYDVFPFIAEMIQEDGQIPDYLLKATFKDFKYLTAEEVLFLRKLNGHKISYKIHFHWISIHIAKFIILFCTLALEVYLYGVYITFLSLLPITLVLLSVSFFLYLGRQR